MREWLLEAQDHLWPVHKVSQASLGQQILLRTLQIHQSSSYYDTKNKEVKQQTKASRKLKGEIKFL